MTAWAICVDGEIDVRTVMPTEIGAMVNWLAVACNLASSNGVSDHAIQTTFQMIQGQSSKSIECCPVEVRRALQ